MNTMTKSMIKIWMMRIILAIYIIHQWD